MCFCGSFFSCCSSSADHCYLKTFLALLILGAQSHFRNSLSKEPAIETKLICSMCQSFLELQQGDP